MVQMSNDYGHMISRFMNFKVVEMSHDHDCLCHSLLCSTHFELYRLCGKL